MLPLYTQIAFWSIPTFRLTVTLAILASIALGIYRLRPRGRVMDACLGALVLGIFVARLVHVALNWDYFTDNTPEVWQIGAGGLDWHGALLGALLGIGLMLWLQPRLSRLIHPSSTPQTPSSLSFSQLISTLTPALPLIGLGGWVGCLAAGCGYGTEVDSLANYPRWAVSELVDVFGIVAPRYNTPYFGIALCLLGLLIVLLLKRWGSASAAHFWLVLALLSLGMFGIGFYRADHTLAAFGLRGDQILDLVIALWSIVILTRRRRIGHDQTP